MRENIFKLFVESVETGVTDVSKELERETQRAFENSEFYEFFADRFATVPYEWVYNEFNTDEVQIYNTELPVAAILEKDGTVEFRDLESYYFDPDHSAFMDTFEDEWDEFLHPEKYVTNVVELEPGSEEEAMYNASMDIFNNIAPGVNVVWADDDGTQTAVSTAKYPHQGMDQEDVDRVIELLDEATEKDNTEALFYYAIDLSNPSIIAITPIDVFDQEGCMCDQLEDWCADNNVSYNSFPSYMEDMNDGGMFAYDGKTLVEVLEDLGNNKLFAFCNEFGNFMSTSQPQAQPRPAQKSQSRPAQKSQSATTTPGVVMNFDWTDANAQPTDVSQNPDFANTDILDQIEDHDQYMRSVVQGREFLNINGDNCVMYAWEGFDSEDAVHHVGDINVTVVAECEIMGGGCSRIVKKADPTKKSYVVLDYYYDKALIISW